MKIQSPDDVAILQATFQGTTSNGNSVRALAIIDAWQDALAAVLIDLAGPLAALAAVAE